MTFADKLREIRNNEKLTQPDMAAILGVSIRTYKAYELGETLPRYRKIYHKIVEEFNVDLNYLLTEGEAFVITAGEQHGPRGVRGAIELINDARSLFAGGELSENDKKAVFDALQEAFFEAKLENKKYTPKKYLQDDDA